MMIPKPIMAIFLEAFALGSIKFLYRNIIEYQHVGDAKTPLLRAIDSKQR